MSPTIKTLLYGFIALTATALFGHLVGGSTGSSLALLWFFPIWFVYCTWHMSVGVRRYGYGVMEELPFLVLNFTLPAAAAWFVRHQLT